MPTTPFEIDPTRTTITVAYRNESYIADQVLPRVRVEAEEFTYLSYPLGEMFRFPDTRVGRHGAPNEVALTANEDTAKTLDYGLEDPIPQKDIENASIDFDPLDRATMQMTDYIMLDREIRTAALVFNETNYDNKITLAGNAQWSNLENSDPVEDILTGMDACLMKPNVIVMGQKVWSVLRRHPKMVQAIRSGSAQEGLIERRQLSELLEVEEVLVGMSWKDTAKPGVASAIARIWGEHVSLIYRNRLADSQRGITFGFTAQFGERVTWSFFDERIGLRGGTRVRVGESVKELIVAPKAGYFIKNAVA